ncbi:hypothetical protein ACFW04_001044 [Cataglyphis niger]
MRTVLFAIIIVIPIANIMCGFDTKSFEDKLFSRITNTHIFTNFSTAIITYVELKDVSSLKEPSYINQLIKSKNLILSNMSLKMLTTLLANGVKEGSTEEELMSLWNLTDKRSLNNLYLHELTFLKDIKNIEMHLENAIYVQKSIDLKADFLSLCINKFHCSISKVDFRNEIQVADTINSWVQDTTNNKILHLISPVNIDEDTKIMLVNTAYLNIEWPNIKEEMEKREFHVSPSESQYVPTIKFEKSTFIHGEIPHWKAKFIEIPFLNTNITMDIFLPNEEMEPGSESLNYLLDKFDFKEFKLFKTAYTNKLEQDMELYLPKFTIQYTQNMTDFFHERNVITMFEDKADFTHLSEIPLKVSNFVQKIVVKLTKEHSNIPEVVKKEKRKRIDLSQDELIVDRPFVYIIETNGIIWFMGSVRAPDKRGVIFTNDEL